MPPSESFGSIYESLERVWRARLFEASQREPTGKHVLCGYVSTVDRCIPVTEPLVQVMIVESDVTADQIAAVREATSPPATAAKSKKDVVLALLWSLEHQGGRISIHNDHLCLLNWLNSLSERFGDGERLGGAPGSMVDTLTRLCREPEAVIFTAFHSVKQASVYERGIRFLTADPPAKLGTVDAKEYHQHRSDRPDDPDVRNYPFEYQPGVNLSWGPDPTARLAVEKGPDRLICTAPYLHFEADGHVRAGHNPSIIERIFQFPGLNDAERDACAVRVAADFPYMALSGPQSAADSQRPAIERDLAMLLGKVTIHMELSGARNPEWLRTLSTRYVSSIGVNDDELPKVSRELVGTTTAISGRYTSIWEFYQDARGVAKKLDLPRLYVHAHTADLVLRRLPVDDKALSDEILADLFAKRMVIEWLRRRPAPDLPQDIGPMRAGLEALLDFSLRIADAPGKTWLQWLEDAESLAKQGFFRDEGDYAVAVVPVAWFYGVLPARIITTGAGDRSSVVSFVQSCFTQPRPANID